MGFIGVLNLKPHEYNRRSLLQYDTQSEELCNQKRRCYQPYPRSHGTDHPTQYPHRQPHRSGYLQSV